MDLAKGPGVFEFRDHRINWNLEMAVGDRESELGRAGIRGLELELSSICGLHIR